MKKAFLLLGLKRLQARVTVIRTNFTIMFIMNFLSPCLCL